MGKWNAAIAATTFSICLGLLPAHSYAQLSHGTLPKVNTVQTGRALVESTKDVFPQISHTVLERFLSPENATPSLPPAAVSDAGLFPTGSAYLRPRVNLHGASFPGVGFTGWVPPDPNLAVGPTAIVEVVNSSVGFFTKGGQKTFEQDMVGANGFFSGLGAGNFIYDPKCTYDRNAKRFYVLALELDQTNGISKILLAISANSDPNGVWFKYRIEAKLTVGSNSYWMDYPSLGYNKDGIMVNGSMFPLGSGNIAGVEFVVLPKARMISGQGAAATVFVDANTFSAQSGRTVDPAVPVIYGSVLTSGSSMRVYACKSPAATPSMVYVDMAIPPYQDANGAADSVGGSQIETLPGRNFGLEYRNGKLYTGHSVASSNSDDTSACRWYELATNGWPTTSAPTVSQAGNIVVGNGTAQFMPAINVNGAGDIAVCFSRCSPTIVSDMMIAGRRKSDPPGSLSVPVAIKHGQGTYGYAGYNRWGDYFDVAIDPNDDLTFWGACMVGDSTGNWITEIQSWKISLSIGIPTEVNPNGVVEYVGGATSGNAASLNSIDGNVYSIQSALVTGIGQAAGATISYNLGLGADKLSALEFKFDSASTVSTTVFIYAYNYVTHRNDFVKAMPVGTSLGKLETVNLPNFANYIDGSGNVSIVVRALSGSSSGSTPFNFSTDMAHAVLIPK